MAMSEHERRDVFYRRVDRTMKQIIGDAFGIGCYTTMIKYTSFSTRWDTHARCVSDNQIPPSLRLLGITVNIEEEYL
jgi:hypothetical protein